MALQQRMGNTSRPAFKATSDAASNCATGEQYIELLSDILVCATAVQSLDARMQQWRISYAHHWTIGFWQRWILHQLLYHNGSILTC
jgi:hypothetical protein